MKTKLCSYKLDTLQRKQHGWSSGVGKFQQSMKLNYTLALVSLKVKTYLMFLQLESIEGYVMLCYVTKDK